MQYLSIIRSPDILGSTLIRFLAWYFTEMPVRIIKGGFKYVSAFNEIFSFFFLIKTFFKPWKSIIDRYPSRGFDIGKIAQAFTLNCTSRIIGMIFRTTAFVIGTVFEAIVIAILIAYFVLWFFLPALMALDVFYLIGIL